MTLAPSLDGAALTSPRGDSQPAAAGVVDVLLFQVGDEVYGADAAQVLRIERPSEGAFSLSSLGTLRNGKRALVFRGEEAEGQLKVDVVLGVRGVSVQALRKLPLAAAFQPYAIGLWLSDERPVLLIDLVKTLTSR